MPHAHSLTTAQAAMFFATLKAHGLHAEAKRHRGLWAGRVGRGSGIFGASD